MRTFSKGAVLTGAVIISAAAFLTCLFPYPSWASVGVGIGTGKIEVDAPLKPGTRFDLPSIPILNTGTEPADYTILIQYHLDQPQMRPDREWFTFEPSTFRLEPQSSRVIRGSITLPVKVEGGDYFAYIEARPQQKSVSGGAAVGVAAAAKLYFSVESASTWQGTYWYLASIIKAHAPWTTIVPLVIAAAVLLKIMSRFFSINIGVRRRP